MRLVRPLMTNLKMTVRFDWAVFCGYPLPPHTHSVYKSSHCLLVKGGGSKPLDRYPSPSPTPVASIWNKANFPFPNLACLLALERQGARSTASFGNMTTNSALFLTDDDAYFVTNRDPLQLSQDRSHPHILYCSSSLKYPDNSMWWTFLE